MHQSPHNREKAFVKEISNHDSEPVKVYNFEVKKNHTYLISNKNIHHEIQSIVVHNSCINRWGDFLRNLAGAKKIPTRWGIGSKSKKKIGWRWHDSNDVGNSVRIDQGNPNSPFTSQQVDHFRVDYKGKIIGRDGNLVSAASQNPKPSKTEEAHIPLSEWLKWSNWNSP